MYEFMLSFVKNFSMQVKDKKICLGCNCGINYDEMFIIEFYIVELF